MRRRSASGTTTRRLEAAAGPHDATGLFDQFCEIMEASQ